MTLLQRYAPGNTETLTALCGPNEMYSAQLILIASLWRDDLNGLASTKLRARHFTNGKLRKLAALVIGSTATFGLNDIETIKRLLVTRCDISGQWVDITFHTLDQIAELIAGSDVAVARCFLEADTKQKAVA